MQNPRLKAILENCEQLQQKKDFFREKLESGRYTINPLEIARKLLLAERLSLKAEPLEH